MNQTKYIGKFKFDLENGSCVWIKENGDQFTVPKEWSGTGKVAFQKWFQLERENNPGHWINFSQTFSRDRVWVNIWYKKVGLEGTRNDYFKKMEKTDNICGVEFTVVDEMIRFYDEKKTKRTMEKKSSLLTRKTFHVKLDKSCPKWIANSSLILPETLP